MATKVDKMVLKMVAEVCVSLDQQLCPAFTFVDPDNGDWSQTGHWSCTKDEMRKHLKRRLSQQELWALSFGRCYGPLPDLSEDVWPKVWAHLWPGGNHTGAWYGWWSLGQKLREVADAL